MQQSQSRALRADSGPTIGGSWWWWRSEYIHPCLWSKKAGRVQGTTFFWQNSDTTIWTKLLCNNKFIRPVSSEFRILTHHLLIPVQLFGFMMEQFRSSFESFDGRTRREACSNAIPTSSWTCRRQLMTAATMHPAASDTTMDLRAQILCFCTYPYQFHVSSNNQDQIVSAIYYNAGVCFFLMLRFWHGLYPDTLNQLFRASPRPVQNASKCTDDINHQQHRCFQNEGRCH